MRPILTEASPPERFDEVLEDVDARLVVAGHTHMQFKRDRWVNAGSVGWAAEDDVAAFWAIVSDDVEFRRTPFDVERAAERDPRVGLARGGVVRRGERPSASVARGSDRLVRVPRVRIQVGRVGKPHGLEGAFVVEEASDDPERFAVGATLLVGGEPARGGRVEAGRRPTGDPRSTATSSEVRRSRSSAATSLSPRRASTTRSSSSASRSRKPAARSSAG